MDMEYRKERDSMGEINVPMNALWGAQTQRSIENFHISNRKFPWIFISSLIEIKRACAIANSELGEISKNIADAIISACDKLLDGDYQDQFPLDIFQTGSGTQTNMNVNEVIANLAQKISGIKIHPNDHVNRGQSSNDTIPTAMHVSTLRELSFRLIPSLDYLIGELQNKSNEFMKIIKIGRTHLQDAVPMSLGQEFSAYVAQLNIARSHILLTNAFIEKLAIGGTAVGTGLNANEDLDVRVCEILSERFGLNFFPSTNKFAQIAGKDGLHAVSGALRVLATVLMKIANDIRWLASGPRAGLGEINLPANEPGSSIMPGKINPTQNEMLIQVAAQVIGNDTTVSTGAQWGILQLNLMKPVIISNILESIDILSNGMTSFAKRAIHGITVNEKRISQLVENSLMLVTALTKLPNIGYDLAAKLAKKALNENKSIKQVILEEKLMDEKELEKALRLDDMINISRMNKNFRK